MSSLKKVQVLPNYIYTQVISNEITDEVMSVVSDPDLYEDESDTGLYQSEEAGNLHEHPKLKEFVGVVQNAIDGVCLQQRIECKLQITQMWANKITPGGVHPPHHHPNSVISGVFYPTVIDSQLEIATPSIWYPLAGGYDFRNTLDVMHVEKAILVQTLDANKNSLVLFPSSLQHGVSCNSIDVFRDRFSISFNTWISGPFGKSEFFAGAVSDNK